MNILLFGFRNSGKSTLGKRLAKHFHREFLDTDQMLEEKYKEENGIKLSCAEIYQNRGGKYFRDLETKILSSLKKYQDFVIALGGGFIDRPSNVKLLKNVGFLVYLSLSKEVLWKRFEKRPPVFADKNNLSSSFEKIYTEREGLYQKYADVTVVLSDHEPEKNVELLVEYIREHGK